MRFYIPALCLFLSPLSGAAETAPAVPAAPAAPAGLQLPECVIQDASSGAIYCSNIGGSEATAENVTAKDKNGFISILNPDGTVKELRVLPAAGDAPLNGPKGMAIANNTLWVADIDRVVGFDLATKKQTKVFDLKPLGAGFANDLLIAGSNGPLLCSDTTSDQVFSIAISGSTDQPITVLGKGIFGGANGLAINGEIPYRKLIVAGFPINDMETANGKMLAFPWDNANKLGVAETLPFPAGLWDGCASLADGSIVASDWASSSIYVSKIDAPPIALADGLKGPADFCVLADGSGILVPEMQANKVTRVDF